MCFAGRSHGKYAYGVENFTNHTSHTVTFDRIGLRRPDHLKVLGAYLAPPDRSAKIGALNGWPPHDVAGYTDWVQRRPVRGYQLRPGATAEAILGFQLTAPTGGRSPGMLIWYHSAGGSYLLRDDLEIQVAAAGRECP